MLKIGPQINYEPKSFVARTSTSDRREAVGAGAAVRGGVERCLFFDCVWPHEHDVTPSSPTL